MKCTKLLFQILLLTFSTLGVSMVLEDDKDAIEKTVTQFLHAYENRDAAGLASFYTEDATVIGTGVDEILVGKKTIQPAFERDFAQSMNSHVTREKISLSAKSGFGFAAYHLLVTVKFPNNTEQSFKLRFTISLEKLKDKWKVKQSHISAPMLGQDAGESFPKKN